MRPLVLEYAELIHWLVFLSRCRRLTSYINSNLFHLVNVIEINMVTTTNTSGATTVNPREKALEDFRKKIMEHKEIEARLKQCLLLVKTKNQLLIVFYLVRDDLRTLTKNYDKSENDLKALQSVGQVTENHLLSMFLFSCF